jgi:thiamine kinase-like enzyme
MTDVERLERLPIWADKPLIVPSGLGRTNSNFIVTDGGSKYFARVGRDLPHHAIQRSVEALTGRIAADHGVGPKVHFAEDGILVLALIDGRPLGMPDGRDRSRLARIARLLRQLHAIPVDLCIPAFSPIESARRYLTMTDDLDLPAPRRRIEARLAGLRACGTRAIVHGDLIPENFIESGERLFLVDWEYAGLSAPEVDMALAVANFELRDEEAEVLFESYGSVDRKLVGDMLVAAIVREALWCIVQSRHGGLAGDLATYSDVCMARMLEVLQ